MELMLSRSRESSSPGSYALDFKSGSCYDRDMGLLRLALWMASTIACSAAQQYPKVSSVVSEARADQLSFASKYQQKGIAFRGTVQKKGVKASTGTGFDFSAYGLGSRGSSLAVGSGRARRVNVNYGYVFLGEGADVEKRALCLFEPEELGAAANLQPGQVVTLTCMFSKFVGSETQPTPVFWGCSVLD